MGRPEVDEVPPLVAPGRRAVDDDDVLAAHGRVLERDVAELGLAAEDEAVLLVQVDGLHGLALLRRHEQRRRAAVDPVRHDVLAELRAPRRRRGRRALPPVRVLGPLGRLARGDQLLGKN